MKKNGASEIKTGLVTNYGPHRNQKTFGFAAVPGVDQTIYFNEKTYRKPEIINGSLRLRTAGKLRREPYAREEIKISYMADGMRNYAVAWCFAIDAETAMADYAEREAQKELDRISKAIALVGKEVVDDFPQIVDVVNDKIIPRLLISATSSGVRSLREMPKNFERMPQAAPARGTWVRWLALVREANKRSILELSGKGDLEDQLRNAKVELDRETGMPPHAHKLILIKLVERVCDGVDCFAYYRSRQPEASAA